MHKTEIEKFANLEEMSSAAAARIAGAILSAVQHNGRAGIVLAGGRTPARTYQMLAADRRIPWERVHLFWGDERWLPPGAPDSNFFMVQETLLGSIALPTANLHCPDFAAGSPQKAAALYEEEIRAFLDGEQSNRQPGFFDMTILGMGEDGHTASLFPGDALLKEEARYAAAVEKPAGKPPVPRISMTLPALDRSRKILFLISGSGKLKILQDILSSKDGSGYPAARVQAVEEVRWLVTASPADFATTELKAP